MGEDLGVICDELVDDGDSAAETEVVPGPRHVEFAPFPQHAADEVAALRKEEDDLAWTYDYIPTSVGDQGHVPDQYGVRIQKTRPVEGLRQAHRNRGVREGRGDVEESEVEHPRHPGDY